MLPKNHNYFHKMPETFDPEAQNESDKDFHDDCVICMNPLHIAPTLSTAESESNPYMRRLKSKKNEIMISPCNHKFHISCLL